MKLDRQQYTLRVSPSNFKKRKAQHAYYDHLSEKPNFEQKEYNCDQIKERNHDWLLIHFLKRKIELLDTQHILLQDRETVLLNKAKSLTYKDRNLVQTQIQKTELILTRYKSLNKLDKLLLKYHAIGSGSTIDDFISVVNIYQNLIAENPTNSPWLGAEELHKSTLIEREIDLELAERNQLLDFVQLRYDGPHTDGLNERLSVGLGIKLNKTSDSKLKLEELKLEQQEVLSELSLKQELHDDKLSDAKHKLKERIAYYNYFNEAISKEGLKLESLQESILLGTVFDPLLILEIQERTISNKLEQLDLLLDIYTEYLDFISDSDPYCENSDQNWLK